MPTIHLDFSHRVTRPPYKLAVLASHPIQYQVPLFRAISKNPEIDLEVLFCSRFGLDRYHDPGFLTNFSWDTPLLDGYRSKFLTNISARSGTSSFWGVLNPT